MNLINKNGLKIDPVLFDFINKEVIPGTDIKFENFWNKFEKAIHELTPINKDLLHKREIIQNKINKWHKENVGENFNKEKYKNFLRSISYIIEEKDDFKISTSNVDKEISEIAGPQLVVPVDNARYALNAANARWGSLYNALYGTDVIPGERNNTYDTERGRKVIAYVRQFLDQIIPLAKGSWNDVSKIQVENGELVLLQKIKKII